MATKLGNSPTLRWKQWNSLEWTQLDYQYGNNFPQGVTEITVNGICQTKCGFLGVGDVTHFLHF